MLLLTIRPILSVNDGQHVELTYLTDNTDNGALRLKRIEADQH